MPVRRLFCPVAASGHLAGAGTAYEFATGARLASGDFEGGKSGAVKVLGAPGFNVQPKQR